VYLSNRVSVIVCSYVIEPINKCTLILLVVRECVSILCDASDENQVTAGERGYMQAILSSIERYASVAAVAEVGFWALGAICVNGSL
jgi:hypothetical protein